MLLVGYVKLSVCASWSLYFQDAICHPLQSVAPKLLSTWWLCMIWLSSPGLLDCLYVFPLLWRLLCADNFLQVVIHAA